MKTNNAERFRGQERCAQSDDTQQKCEQGNTQARRISGHELLPPSHTLRNVGKRATYHGGFRFGPGSQAYRKMSAVVAEKAAEVGHDLYRRGRKKAAQFLLGLPDNEHLAICYTAYKHDKRLPSVALVDTTQTAANLQYHYETNVRGRTQLAALTVPALENRVSIDGYKDGIALAFKRINKLKAAFKKSGVGEFIYVQLETPFDAESQTFYLHFHVFLTFALGEHSRRRALTFITENTPWLQSHAGIHLKCIADKDVPRSIRYGTKPSATAYEIAASENIEVFEVFLDVSKGRRLTRAEGPLKATIKMLREEGRRAVFRKCERNGQSTVALVEKRTEKVLELPKPRQAVSNDTPRAQNIFCGSGRPISSPGGRLLAFGYVQDFCENTLDISAGKGVSGSLFEANKIAREAWERNTRRPYDLKEFLAPIANDVMRLMNNADVQSYTVIASPYVLETLREIQKQGKSGDRQKGLVYNRSALEKSFSSKLKIWGSKLISGLSRFRILIHRLGPIRDCLSPKNEA